MDRTTLRIAAAALLHDIGKLVEQEPVEEALDEFCPRHEGRRFHGHAASTAAFLRSNSSLLPSQLSEDSESEDSVIELAAGHHHPRSPLQWIVAEADRISNGLNARQWERYNRTPDLGNAGQQRLLSLFEELRQQKVAADLGYCYPLSAISAESIFPIPVDAQPADDQDINRQKKALADGFLQGLKTLPHRRESAALWLEHLDSLLLTYASNLPSALVEGGTPDVSLYDHSKTVAALAPALLLFHKATDSLDSDSIRGGSQVEKLLFVTGSFYGIQNFIFRTRGISQRYRSKLLRGRSAFVSILSELAADLLCNRLGLPATSVLLNAAGRFTVVAPNTPNAKNALRGIEEQINKWLMKGSYGETAMGLSHVDIAPADLTENRLSEVWEKANQITAERKLLKIDFDHQGGVFEGFLNRFNNTLAQPLCPFCGKRPSDRECRNKKVISDEGSSCRWCLDHIVLGTRIIQKPRLIVWRSSAKGPYGKGLLEPIFGEYQLGFASEGKLYKNWAASGKLVKYWGIGLSDDRLPQGVTVRLIQGHAPVYTGDDLPTPEEGDEEQLKIGDVKTFDDIAAQALSTSEDGSLKGIDALGALKADVDNLGLLMTCGLGKDRLTLARLSALSRQVNLFFTLWLPRYLETNREFSHSYTVFAGGDDLLLIGPWNRMRHLAASISRRFAEYVCRNSEVHLSAGISLHRAGASLAHMSRASEQALESSKHRRNRLTMFDETVSWSELDELEKCLEEFDAWRGNGWLGGAMMHRFNDFIRLAEEERRLRKSQRFTLDRLQCLKWRAHFGYAVGRNVGRNLEGGERDQAIHRVRMAAGWLQGYGSKLRIPLWDFLYNQRDKRGA